MSPYKAFGDRIAQERREKSVRERRDILQKDVAKAIGTTPTTLSRWEAGDVMPRDAILSKLAKYFGVTIAWLRYGTEPREAPPTTQFPSARLAPHPSTKQSGKPRKQA